MHANKRTGYDKTVRNPRPRTLKRKNLFFRWLKCVLGCKQLLTTSENGVALQIYTALIASLLIVLWTGRKPTKRTWEMLQFYFQGWASLEEVQAHLEKQKLIALKSQETDGPPKKT